MQWSFSLKHERISKKPHNTIVIHNSNTDLGGNSNSNLLIFSVIVIVTYYIDLGSNYCNSNCNIR